jgi:two-component system nitrogen regulation response regulator GlnG
MGVAPLNPAQAGVPAVAWSEPTVAAPVEAAVAPSWVPASVPSGAGESVSAQGADGLVSSSVAVAAAAPASAWLGDLEREARSLLNAGQTDVWDVLTRQFEARLIHTALDITRGRRIEAAQKLGIGRNTITRKIQELGMDE